MRGCGRLESFVPAGRHDLSYFFDNGLRCSVDIAFRELLQHEAGGCIIGMYHIDVVKAVVPQHIDDQLIRWKVIKPAEFINEMVDGFYEPGLAPIVLHNTIPGMPDGAYGEDHLQIRVELEELVEAIVQGCIDLFDGHEMFTKELRGSAVAVGDGLACWWDRRDPWL